MIKIRYLSAIVLFASSVHSMDDLTDTPRSTFSTLFKETAEQSVLTTGSVIATFKFLLQKNQAQIAQPQKVGYFSSALQGLRSTHHVFLIFLCQIGAQKTVEHFSPYTDPFSSALFSSLVAGSLSVPANAALNALFSGQSPRHAIKDLTRQQAFCLMLRETTFLSSFPLSNTLNQHFATTHTKVLGVDAPKAAQTSLLLGVLGAISNPFDCWLTRLQHGISTSALDLKRGTWARAKALAMFGGLKSILEDKYKATVEDF